MTNKDYWEIGRTVLDVIGALYIIGFFAAWVGEHFAHSSYDARIAARKAHFKLAEERRRRLKTEMRLQGDPTERSDEK